MNAYDEKIISFRQIKIKSTAKSLSVRSENTAFKAKKIGRHLSKQLQNFLQKDHLPIAAKSLNCPKHR